MDYDPSQAATFLQHEVQRNQIGLAKAKELFDEFLQNYQFKQGRQRDIASSNLQARGLELQAAPWAIPDGMEYFPGYEPGGLGAHTASIYGGDPKLMKDAEIKIKPINFDPRGDVRRAYSGEYDWPDIPTQASNDWYQVGLPAPKK